MTGDFRARGRAALAAQEVGSVAVHRVTYPGSFDVLAAGDARYDQVLHQGGVPFGR